MLSRYDESNIVNSEIVNNFVRRFYVLSGKAFGSKRQNDE